MDDADTETGVGAAIAVVAIITVVLRFYVRYYKHAGFKWDDWLILASLIFVIVTDILVVYANSINPNGAEVASTPGAEYSPADVVYTKFSFVATVLYFAITTTTKLSILLLFNRLFSVDDSFRRQIVILSIAVLGYGIGSTIANFLNCIPLKYVWINSLADPRFCINYNIFWFATGLTEAALDVCILLMPIGVVARLQLSTRKRIAVGSVFLVGVFVILSGLLKAVYGYVPGSRQPSFSKTSLWTTVHSGTGIICACLPVCWPVFVRLVNFKDWKWVQSIQTTKRWRSFSSWSRLRPGSSRKDSAIGVEDLPPTSGRRYKLSLRRSTTETFEIQEINTRHHYASFDVERGTSLSPV
ncbi:integral membrane protein [Xylaria flabelliformis]|nr:integral membrane protein [Xylaria flabelliformis]